MNNIILSFILLGVLGTGAVGGAVMNDMDFSVDGYTPRFDGVGGCRGGYVEDGCAFNDDCGECFDDGECVGLTLEECEELHEECRENDHRFCDHDEEGTGQQ
jgi:hypothetical protein